MGGTVCVMHVHYIYIYIGIIIIIIITIIIACIGIISDGHLRATHSLLTEFLTEKYILAVGLYSFSSIQLRFVQ